MTTSNPLLPFGLAPDNRAMIYHGDCNELMRALPAESVDFVLSDPPYGINFRSKVVRNPAYGRAAFKKIKNDRFPYTEWLVEAYRVLKPGGRLICFYRWDVQEAFATAIKAAGFKLKDQLVWDKQMHGTGDLKGGFGSRHELMFYAVKGRYHFKCAKRPRTVLSHLKVNSQSMTHPNEKPISLLNDLISTLSVEDDIILDPFGGSFKTLESALMMKRYCLTAELDDFYHNQGLLRLNRQPLVRMLWPALPFPTALPLAA